MPPEDPENPDGQKASGWQKYRFLIIIVGVIIAIVIAGSVLSNRSPSSTSAEPAVTLSSVNTEVQDHETRLSAAELKAANATEGISDLWGEITGLHTTIEGLPAPQNYSGEIMKLQNDVAALQNQNTSPDPVYPVQVTRVEDEYVDVTTMEAGGYLVMVTLYGTDLTSLSVRYPEVYTIPWQTSNNQTLSAVVQPQAQWALNYTIELRATGTVLYAAAVAGRGQGTGEEGW